MITEHYISKELSIPVFDGKYFCSRRDPIREAASWFSSNASIIENATKIVVLGLGAGFHLHFIPRGKSVFFVEFNQELIQRFNFLSPDSQAKPVNSLQNFSGASILKFRPAMGEHVHIYEAISKYPHINIKVIAEMLAHAPVNDETKGWLTLRELVL